VVNRKRKIRQRIVHVTRHRGLKNLNTNLSWPNDDALRGIQRQLGSQNARMPSAGSTMMRIASAIVSLLSVPAIHAYVSYAPPTFGSRLVSTSLSQLHAERKPFITGNWKMNPKTKQEAIELASGIAAAVTNDSPGDVALFVPYPFIECVQNVVGDKLLVGAEVSIVV
jgi:Triosephosphate isomerase